MKKRNLALEIGILEAKKGIEPAVSKYKNLIEGFLRRKKINETNLDETLNSLRQERLSIKISLVHKQLQRIVKKGRAFAIQKLIKKLRVTKEDEEREQLEERMKTLKGLNPSEMVKFLFDHEILSCNEYLREKLKDVPLLMELSKLDFASVEEIIKGKALEKALKEVVDDLESFIRLLYHEPISPSVAVTDSKARKGKVPSLVKKVEPKKLSSDANSQFVTLNQDRDQDQDQDEDKDGGGDDRRPKKKIKYMEREERELVPVIPHNRKGQRARRAEWEKLYGSQARHLKEPKPLSSKVKSRPPKVPITFATPRRQHSVKESTNVEKLHPSWEAQRRQREILKASLAKPPINQRIKFSENDE